jgi:quercetin dioxygenase-like cupin family protein
MEKALFCKNLSEMPGIPMLPGAKARFIHSQNMSLVYWDFEPGAGMTEHAHPHEQILNLLEGSFELNVGGQTLRLDSGSVLIIPPHVPHSGKALTACRALDVFYPVREDFQNLQAEYELQVKGRG